MPQAVGSTVQDMPGYERHNLAQSAVKHFAPRVEAKRINWLADAKKPVQMLLCVDGGPSWYRAEIGSSGG